MDWLIFGSITIIIQVVLFLVLSRRIHRRYNASEFLDQVQREVNSIVTELNQTTERNIQLIEDRMQRLNRLLAEADKRILLSKQELDRQTHGTYEHLVEKRRMVLRQGAEPNPPAIPAQPEIQPPVEERAGMVSGDLHVRATEGQRVRSRRVDVRPLPPVGDDVLVDDEAEFDSAAIPSGSPVAFQPEAGAPGLSGAALGPDKSRPPNREIMKQQVVDMARAGIASVVIAQRFNLSLGEVELILSLNRDVPV